MWSKINVLELHRKMGLSLQFTNLCKKSKEIIDLNKIESGINPKFCSSKSARIHSVLGEQSSDETGGVRFCFLKTRL